MKTGRDADSTGLYVSDCCQKEVHLLQGQMLPRCPRCYSLTVWELGGQEAEDRKEDRPLMRWNHLHPVERESIG